MGNQCSTGDCLLKQEQHSEMRFPGVKDMKNESCECSPHAKLEVGDLVRAIEGSKGFVNHDKVEVYVEGDDGYVRKFFKVDKTGQERIKIAWVRTGLTTTCPSAKWTTRFQLVRKNGDSAEKAANSAAEKAAKREAGAVLAMATTGKPIVELQNDEEGRKDPKPLQATFTNEPLSVDRPAPAKPIGFVESAEPTSPFAHEAEASLTVPVVPEVAEIEKAAACVADSTEGIPVNQSDDKSVVVEEKTEIEGIAETEQAKEQVDPATSNDQLGQVEMTESSGIDLDDLAPSIGAADASVAEQVESPQLDAAESPPVELALPLVNAEGKQSPTHLDVQMLMEALTPKSLDVQLDRADVEVASDDQGSTRAASELEELTQLEKHVNNVDDHSSGLQLGDFSQGVGGSAPASFWIDLHASLKATRVVEESTLVDETTCVVPGNKCVDDEENQNSKTQPFVEDVPGSVKCLDAYQCAETAQVEFDPKCSLADDWLSAACDKAPVANIESVDVARECENYNTRIDTWLIRRNFYAKASGGL